MRRLARALLLALVDIAVTSIYTTTSPFKATYIGNRAIKIIDRVDLKLISLLDRRWWRSG